MPPMFPQDFCRLAYDPTRFGVIRRAPRGEQEDLKETNETKHKSDGCTATYLTLSQNRSAGRLASGENF